MSRPNRSKLTRLRRGALLASSRARAPACLMRRRRLQVRLFRLSNFYPDENEYSKYGSRPPRFKRFPDSGRPVSCTYIRRLFCEPARLTAHPDATRNSAIACRRRRPQISLEIGRRLLRPACFCLIVGSVNLHVRFASQPCHVRCTNLSSCVKRRVTKKNPRTLPYTYWT